MAARMSHPDHGSGPVDTGTPGHTCRPKPARPARAARARRYEPHARQLTLPGFEHLDEKYRDGPLREGRDLHDLHEPVDGDARAVPGGVRGWDLAAETSGPSPVCGPGPLPRRSPDGVARTCGPPDPPRRGSRDGRDGAQHTGDTHRLPDGTPLADRLLSGLAGLADLEGLTGLPGHPENPTDPEPAPPSPDAPVPFRRKKGVGEPLPERREVPDTGPAAEAPVGSEGPATPVTASEPCSTPGEPSDRAPRPSGATAEQPSEVLEGSLKATGPARPDATTYQPLPTRKSAGAMPRSSDPNGRGDHPADPVPSRQSMEDQAPEAPVPERPGPAGTPDSVRGAECAVDFAEGAAAAPPASPEDESDDDPDGDCPEGPLGTDRASSAGTPVTASGVPGHSERTTPTTADPGRSYGTVGARVDSTCAPQRRASAAGAPHRGTWVPLPRPPADGLFAPSSALRGHEAPIGDGNPGGTALSETSRQGRDPHEGSVTGTGAVILSPRPPGDDACAPRGAEPSRSSGVGTPDAHGPVAPSRRRSPGDDGPAPACVPSGGPGPKAGPGTRVAMGFGRVCARTRVWRTAQRCALLAEGAWFRRPVRRRPRRGARCDAGMSTAEYALGTVTAVAFAGVLYVILTGGTVTEVLTDIVVDALSSGM